MLNLPLPPGFGQYRHFIIGRFIVTTPDSHPLSHEIGHSIDHAAALSRDFDRFGSHCHADRSFHLHILPTRAHNRKHPIELIRAIAHRSPVETAVRYNALFLDRFMPPGLSALQRSALVGEQMVREPVYKWLDGQDAAD